MCFCPATDKMAPPPAHPIITKYDRTDHPRQGYKEAIRKKNRRRNAAIIGSVAATSSGMAAAAASAPGGGGC
ncbi:hypothetical protein N7510_010329 [Penicillium lagena]|uniref:uncharacterized protein n=1 Tax=Penicillium lagena TaxID=94218 RepID=UPI002540F01C|nr:uncharacterized protein N7510_010329 [Penicillium lagena]KAJ5605175.1 hypothetical protein N7510_010329 [Penicillium lagena]